MLAQKIVRTLPVFGLLLVAACSRGSSNPEPVRVTSEAVIPSQSSTIAIPITARIADLEAQLNSRVPASFTSTEAQQATCKQGGRVREIGCQFVGTVTRGPIRVTGVEGGVLTLVVPVEGTVDAKAMSNFVGKQPINAAADIEASVRLDIVGDWQPVAKVGLAYRWTRSPGIEALGRRFSLAAAADPVLKEVISRLETAVPESLEKLQPRQRLASAWTQAFTVLPITAQNPAIWLRMTPQKLHFSNYTIADGVLTLGVGVTALTETFVGSRPADPVATALPPPVPPESVPVFRAHVPVIADYAGLEKLVEAALKQAESPPMQVRGIGIIQPEFGKVSLHATEGGRLAIGITMSAGTPRQWIKPRGTVWLTALPYNSPGSQVLEVRDVRITGSPDTASFRMLLAVARSRVVSRQISRALSQNFTAQYDQALAAAGAALANKPLGDFVLSVKIDHVTNGTLKAVGQGLYLPVDASGTASLRLAPPAA